MMKGIVLKMRNKQWHEQHMLQMKRRAKRRLVNMQRVTQKIIAPIENSPPQKFSWLQFLFGKLKSLFE